MKLQPPEARKSLYPLSQNSLQCRPSTATFFFQEKKTAKNHFIGLRQTSLQSKFNQSYFKRTRNIRYSSLHNSATTDQTRYQRDSSYFGLKGKLESKKISNSQNHDVKIFFMDDILDSSLLPDPKCNRGLPKGKNKMKQLVRSLKTEQSDLHPHPMFRKWKGIGGVSVIGTKIL